MVYISIYDIEKVFRWDENFVIQQSVQFFITLFCVLAVVLQTILDVYISVLYISAPYIICKTYFFYTSNVYTIYHMPFLNNLYFRNRAITNGKSCKGNAVNLVNGMLTLWRTVFKRFLMVSFILFSIDTVIQCKHLRQVGGFLWVLLFWYSWNIVEMYTNINIKL